MPKRNRDDASKDAIDLFGVYLNKHGKFEVKIITKKISVFLGSFVKNDKTQAGMLRDIAQLLCNSDLSDSYNFGKPNIKFTEEVSLRLQSLREQKNLKEFRGTVRKIANMTLNKMIDDYDLESAKSMLLSIDNKIIVSLSTVECNAEFNADEVAAIAELTAPTPPRSPLLYYFVGQENSSSVPDLMTCLTEVFNDNDSVGMSAVLENDLLERLIVKKPRI